MALLYTKSNWFCYTSVVELGLVTLSYSQISHFVHITCHIHIINMDREEGNEVPSVYVYNGIDEVPEDVKHVRVDPSVTVISEGAFLDRRDLEVVELPEGLIRIGESAFCDCESLKRINIPTTIEEIGSAAFRSCDKLDDIILPEGLQRLGQNALCCCKSLKSINIPPNMETIKYSTFFGCSKLTDVVFSEGLRKISEDGFSRCNSLSSINLPSTLKDIGVEAFEGCTRLDEIHMPDTIESIKKGAFEDCNFTNFRIPPQVTEVDISIMNGNRSLISLELSENVNRITIADSGHTVLWALRNIALPSDCVVEDMSLPERCISLLVAFPNATRAENDDEIDNALRQRFDNLPIHKICYYQSYHDNETTIQSLKREINPWTSNPPGQLNITGKEQDCLGMTPLHILACSTKPTIEMYRLLIEKYPETLIMKDKWEDIPLLYAFWCNAPTEVIDLLVESYKTNHPEYEIDWKDMILSLAKTHVPLPNIQRLIATQQSSFPDQEYDMQVLVMELASHDTCRAAFGRPGTDIETFKYLLRLSITRRLDLLDIAKWRKDLENIINAFPVVEKGRDDNAWAVYNKLATYESIKEGTSVLELVLWKAKIDERRNKRARVGGEVDYRDQCRINSGADIVIRNVLPYLLPE